MSEQAFPHSNSQIINIMNALKFSNVRYCFVGGYAIYLHLHKTGISPSRAHGHGYGDLDVLINVTSGSLTELHRLLHEQLWMHPMGSAGVHVFQKERELGLAGNPFAVRYSKQKEYSSDPVDILFAYHPSEPSDVIDRCVEYQSRSDTIPVASIADLIENKRIAVVSPIRSESKRAIDLQDIALLEEAARRREVPSSVHQ